MAVSSQPIVLDGRATEATPRGRLGSLMGAPVAAVGQ